jgi:hypothetical protein
MSENREDDAREGDERIEELPASDSDVAGEEGGGSSSLRSPGDEPVDSDPDEGGELRSSPPPDPGE